MSIKRMKCIINRNPNVMCIYNGTHYVGPRAVGAAGALVVASNVTSHNGTHYVGPGSGAHAVGPLWLVTFTSYNEGRCAAHHRPTFRRSDRAGGAGGAPLWLDGREPVGS